MNYYDLFDIKMTPAVDNTRLAKKYFELQKKFHPDYFVNETEEEKEIALEKSSHINDAFKTFKDKSKTLAYFLKSKAVLEDEEKYNLPMDFLADMLDLNDLVLDEPEKARKMVDEFNTELDNEIEPIIKKAENSEISDNDLQILKEYYFKKKYLSRIFDRIED